MKLNLKPSFKFNLKVRDEEIALINDAKASGKKVSGIKVRIEATHSGIINGNQWFYTPKGMKDGAQTFVKPFPKPVLIQHNRGEDPIGRVEKAEYIDYNIDTDIADSNKPTDIYQNILDFVDSKEFKSNKYKGLGHVELIVTIVDEEAIEKILDKRYLTVSIGGESDAVVCSGCGTNLKDEASLKAYRDSNGECPHYKGEMFQDREIFWIGGKMNFHEVSYVNTPADPNAVSEIVNDSLSDTLYSEITDNFHIIDFEIVDDKINNNITGENEKMTLQELLKDENLRTKIEDILKELGLESHILSDERYEELRKTSFLYAKERAIPVKDKAYILAAYKLLEDLEESDELTEGKEILDGKFQRSFGKVSLEDALATLVADTSEGEGEDTDTTIQDKVEINYDDIADKVVAKLQSLVDLSDFGKSRSELLEQENEILVDEIEKLTKGLKEVIIDQILVLEDELENEKYKSKLQSRTLESLNDKLIDLKVASTTVEDEEEEKSSDKISDDGKISDTEVSLDDDAADKTGKIEDEEEEEEEDKGDKLDVEDVKNTYRKKLRTEGLSLASKYLKGLKDEGKLPDNFTF